MGISTSRKLGAQGLLTDRIRCIIRRGAHVVRGPRRAVEGEADFEFVGEGLGGCGGGLGHGGHEGEREGEGGGLHFGVGLVGWG